MRPEEIGRCNNCLPSHPLSHPNSVPSAQIPISDREVADLRASGSWCITSRAIKVPLGAGSAGDPGAYAGPGVRVHAQSQSGARRVPRDPLIEECT
jgi:hypothetical protein